MLGLILLSSTVHAQNPNNPQENADTSGSEGARQKTRAGYASKRAVILIPPDLTNERGSCDSNWSPEETLMKVKYGKTRTSHFISTIRFLVVPVLCATVSLQGQMKPTASGASRKLTAVMLVDTDDACRLTVDDQDEGVVTPAQSKKINVGLGDHIVKCVVENFPDLMWRKIVEVKSSDQVAAMVQLKALHIQYDQAVGQAQQQKEQAAAAKETVAAAEQKRKSDDAQFPEKFFTQVKGTWRRETHDPDSNWKSEGFSEPSPSYEEEILEILILNDRTITARITGNDGLSDGFVRHHIVYSMSFHISPPKTPADIQCLEKTITYSRGKNKGTRPVSCNSEPFQKDLQIKLLDSNHIELVPRFLPSSAGEREILEKQR
jgi:hypothetical protein